MAEITEMECAQALGGPVNDLGGRFMLDPATFAAAPEVGMEPSHDYYLVGRFGPMGKISAEEVADLMYFIPLQEMDKIWNTNIDKVDVGQVAERFLQCCFDWGKSNLAEIDAGHLQAVIDLGQKVTDAIPQGEVPLVAAIGQMSNPDDTASKAAVVLHQLREARCSRHINALKEMGMDPLTAVLAGEGGQDNARMFMWPEPFPEISEEQKTKRQELEDKTDELASKDFQVLSANERGQLKEAVENIHSSTS